MIIFQNNMMLLRENHPELYARMKIFTPNSTSNRIEIVNSKNQTKNLRAKVKEYGREKQIYLHSNYNPELEAKNFASEQMKDQKQFNFLYGFGLGYHVQEMAKLLSKGNRLIVFELSLDIFYLALTLRDLTDVLTNQQVELNISDNLNVIGHRMAQLMGAETLLKVVIHIPSLTAIEEKYDDLKYILQELNLKKSVSTTYLESLHANYLVNKVLIKNNVGLFFNRFRDIPIIIVCAGPSLDKNKHLLAELANKALIICVGHALKALLKINVKPHFIISIDPDPIVFKQIEGLEQLDIPFILMATAAAINAEQYQGPKFIACQNLNYLSTQESHYLIKTGGSVSTSALDIAIRMGGQPIVFIGQDLAYTQSKHHCDDSFHQDVTIKPLDTMRRVKGWDNNEVPTTLGMISFNKWIQSRILEEKGRIFINATEGGAYIEGLVHTSFREVIDQYLKKDHNIDLIMQNVLTGLEDYTNT